MKKLVLLLAVAFSVSMFSCGNGDAAKGNDSDSVAKDGTEEQAPEKTPAPAPEVNPDATQNVDTTTQA